MPHPPAHRRRLRVWSLHRPAPPRHRSQRRRFISVQGCAYSLCRGPSSQPGEGIRIIMAAWKHQGEAPKPEDAAV